MVEGAAALVCSLCPVFVSVKERITFPQETWKIDLVASNSEE